jgi:hypothetical protein
LTDISDGPTYLDQDPFEELEEDEMLRFDPEVVDPESLSWLERIRIVGLNEKSTNAEHCFTSGTGTCNDRGVFFAQKRSNDPNFPTDKELCVTPQDVPEFRVVSDLRHYTGPKSWTEDGNLLPFHYACYRILKRRAAGRLSCENNEVDATKMWSYLRYSNSPMYLENKTASEESMELDYDYVDSGYKMARQQQFYEFHRGEDVRQVKLIFTSYSLHSNPSIDFFFEHQAFVADPINIPELQEYYANLPSLDQQDLANASAKNVDQIAHGELPLEVADLKPPKPISKKNLASVLPQSTARDCFVMLSPELIIILTHLPARSVVNLKIVSATVRHTSLSNELWRKRVEDTMP